MQMNRPRCYSSRNCTLTVCKGFYLTHETIVDALEQTTHGRDSNVDGAASCVEGSPPVPISNVHRRTRLSFIPSPYDALSLPARRRCRYDECASPPSPDQTPVSDQSLSVLLSPLKKDNLRKRKQDGYSRAIDAASSLHLCCPLGRQSDLHSAGECER